MTLAVERDVKPQLESLMKIRTTRVNLSMGDILLFFEPMLGVLGVQRHGMILI